MRPRPLVALLLGWGVVFHATPGLAQLRPEVTPRGLFQGWFTVYEQYEDARGLFQRPSGDEATDRTTGFSLYRARVGARASWLDGVIGLDGLVELEGAVELLDLALRIQPARGLTLLFGQYKMPSVGENLVEERDLDFTLRTRTAEALADFALSRTVHASSLFYGNRSTGRDCGLGVKLEQRVGPVPVRAFAMLGNGLGANLFIGGLARKQFILTNPVQFYYAGRLELEPVPGWLSLGGHASRNRHDDLLFNSGRAVIDLDRTSWSADGSFRVPGTGVRAGGLAGGGSVDEDYDGNGRTDYRYRGWSAYLLWELTPLLVWLTGGWWGADHRPELGFRYEDFRDGSDGIDQLGHHRVYTLGATYRYTELLKLQLNATFRRDEVPYEPDLDDDGLNLALQLAF